MVNSTDSISVYRQIFNAVVRPNLWLPYFQARGTLSGSIKGIIFYIVLMLFIMTLGSVSVNLLKPEATTTLAELLINPTLARNISLMSVFVLTNIVNMVFAGAVIFGTTLTCGLLQIVLFFKTFKIALDIPYLTIAVAGGIGGGISILTLSLLEKIGL